LHRTPYSTLASGTQRLSVTNLARRQSGHPYSDAVLSGNVTNISDVPIQNGEVHVFLSDLPYVFCEVPTIEPGATVPFKVICKDACIPFSKDYPSISAELLFGPSVRIRIVYRFDTDGGSIWAEDTPFPMPEGYGSFERARF